MIKIALLVAIISGANNLLAETNNETVIKLPAFPRYEPDFLTQVKIDIPPSQLPNIIETAAGITAASAIIIWDDWSDKGKMKIMRYEKEKSSLDLLSNPNPQASYETR